jgi:hypothetical protein
MEQKGGKEIKIQKEEIKDKINYFLVVLDDHEPLVML